MRTPADKDANKFLFCASEPGCVLYLPALPGGGNKIYDRSPYGNNVNIVGATWKVLSSGLWYLYFDGTDDYLCPGDSIQYDITDKITLGAWVNLDVLGLNRYVMGRDNVSYRNYLLHITNDNKVIFYIWNSNTAHYGKTATTLTAKRWHLVGGTYNKVAVKAYLDGVKGTDTETSCNGDIDNGNAPLEIGGRESYPSGPMRLAGGIALPFLCNYAWSDLQWASYFNQTKHLFGVW